MSNSCVLREERQVINHLASKNNGRMCYCLVGYGILLKELLKELHTTVLKTTECSLFANRMDEHERKFLFTSLHVLAMN